jgi:hypothetical protein
MRIKYDSNNSGGRWWLKDADWDALAAAGWRVRWGGRLGGPHETPKVLTREQVETERYLGALAVVAEKDFETPGDAMREFEQLTGKSVTDEGCGCCGAPHAFYWPNGGASGRECADYMFENAPLSYREAIEELERLRGKE